MLVVELMFRGQHSGQLACQFTTAMGDACMPFDQGRAATSTFFVVCRASRTLQLTITDTAALFQNSAQEMLCSVLTQITKPVILLSVRKSLFRCEKSVEIATRCAMAIVAAYQRLKNTFAGKALCHVMQSTLRPAGYHVINPDFASRSTTSVRKQALMLTSLWLSSSIPEPRFR